MLNRRFGSATYPETNSPIAQSNCSLSIITRGRISCLVYFALAGECQEEGRARGRGALIGAQASDVTESDFLAAVKGIRWNAHGEWNRRQKPFLLLSGIKSGTWAGLHFRSTIGMENYDVPVEQNGRLARRRPFERIRSAHFQTWLRKPIRGVPRSYP